MNQLHRNVCSTTVANDLCIGCGLCAGICPANALVMQYNHDGMYVPIEQDGCLPTCDLCLRACPFVDHSDDETTLAEMDFGLTPGMRYRPEVGYYLGSYVGYSQVDGHRANGASGGLATWFLETLLTQGIVDKVICVTPNPGSTSRLFQFAVLDSVEAVRNGSRSCYYPVEVSTVIREVLAQDARYAITGLPCFLKGLRLAMRTDARLRRRIVARVGLVCGQTKTRFFAEYLCAICGGEPDSMVEAQFRLKDPSRSAKDYLHKFTSMSGGKPVSHQLFWTGGIEDAWVCDYFKPNACNYCDDLFAETADVVFMDAWLPEYSRDYRGHSLVINRHALFKPLWEAALQSKDVSLTAIPISAVLRSQEGALHQKREILAYRLHLAKRVGHQVPRKRVEPSKRVGRVDRWLTKLKLDARTESLSVWHRWQDPDRLEKALRLVTLRIKAIRLWIRIYKAFVEGRAKSALVARMKRALGRKQGG